MRKLRPETIFVVFILAVVVLALAFHYQQSPAPSTTESSAIGISNVSVLNIESVGFSSTELLVQFRVNNPTPFSTTLQNASYFLYGNGNYLGSGTITEKVKIPADNSTYVESNFSTGLYNGAKVIFSYIFSNNNQIIWVAEGNATFSEPLIGLVTVHFDSS